LIPLFAQGQACSPLDVHAYTPSFCTPHNCLPLWLFPAVCFRTFKVTNSWIPMKTIKMHQPTAEVPCALPPWAGWRPSTIAREHWRLCHLCTLCLFIFTHFYLDRFFYTLRLLLWVFLDVQLDSAEDEDASANGGGAVRPTPLGRVASLYYLQHTTAALIAERFRGRQLTHTEVRRAGHAVSDAAGGWSCGASREYTSLESG
jgi:hypothetical protein